MQKPIIQISTGEMGGVMDIQEYLIKTKFDREKIIANQRVLDVKILRELKKLISKKYLD